MTETAPSIRSDEMTLHAGVQHLNSECCGLPCLGTLKTGPLDGQLSQRFFEQLAASINTPHVGDVYRDCVRSILLRAVEAGLYTEPK